MKHKILIVDDEEHILKLLQMRLLKSGYEVITAEDGTSAIELALTHEVDLIILDVLMPGINGLDLCKKMKAHSGLKTVPVILLTALASSESKNDGMKVGADAYITKPYNANELLAKVQQLIQNGD